MANARAFVAYTVVFGANTFMFGAITVVLGQIQLYCKYCHI